MIVTDRLTRVITLKKKLPPQPGQTYVIAWTAPERMTPEELDRWMEKENTRHNGIWLMGFHPDAEEAEGIPEMPIEIESSYAVILMQQLSLVASAARKLKQTGYYKGYSDAELADIQQRDDLAHLHAAAGELSWVR